jgi:cardiolipin synthase C
MYLKRRAVSTALILLVVMLALWTLGRIWMNRTGAPTTAVPSSLIQLGAYSPDMSLRAAFESLPPAGGARTGLTLLSGNTDAWAARWQMLANARESIDVSYFIVREDLFGAAFLGHLLHKAKQGVKIRLMFDSQGTLMSFVSPRGSDWLDTLANTEHVQLKLFRPLLSRYIEALMTANPVAAVASEHDKILVGDHRVGMIGGRNISAEYFADPKDLPTAFEDVDVILHGESVARGLTAAFEAQFSSDGARPVKPERLDLASYEEELLLAYRAMDAWLRGTALDVNTAARIKALHLGWLDDLEKYPLLRGTARRSFRPEVRAEARLLDSQTRLEPHADLIAQGFLRLAQSTRNRILVQSPYLVLSQEAVDVLAAIGRRGVAIDILTNSPISSDNSMSQAFFLEQWPELLARVPGLRIFVAGQPNTVHTKLAVFDENVTLVGTYNLDPVSMAVNSEIMAAVWSHAFARRAADLRIQDRAERRRQRGFRSRRQADRRLRPKRSRTARRMAQDSDLLDAAARGR